MEYPPELIARICHEANRELQFVQQAPGVPVAGAWDEFPRDQRDGVIAGVVAAIGGATPAQLHDLWRAAKLDDGWQYGLRKDPVAKTHPCLVPYDRLPEDQQIKDILFCAIVGALSGQPADSDAGRLPQRHAAVAAQAGYRWMAERAPHLAAAGDTTSYRFQQLCVQLGLFVAEYDAMQPQPAGPGEELPRRVPAVPVQIDEHPAVPRIADRVHYVSYGTPAGEYPPACRAAIVTEIPAHGHTIALAVLNPTGMFFDRDVPADPGTYDGPERTFHPGAEMPPITCDDVRFEGGSWHWPL